MGGQDWLAERFEEHRPHLRAVSYRMLGSLSDADDAVQEAWLRLSQVDGRDVENLRAWLTTVVARICLNVLRTRRSRGEQPLGPHLPDPIISVSGAIDPEQEALIADSVGLALLVVLDTLTPAERLAFVLHDTFAVGFKQIAQIMGRSESAARQLASRGRRRLQQTALAPDVDLADQQKVVRAFMAAARGGDLNALIAVLDPDVVLRFDAGTAGPARSRELRGARAVAHASVGFYKLAYEVRPALVNGAAGAVALLAGRPYSVLGFTIVNQRIVAMDTLADPARLERLRLTDFS